MNKFINGMSAMQRLAFLVIATILILVIVLAVITYPILGLWLLVSLGLTAIYIAADYTLDFIIKNWWS